MATELNTVKIVQAQGELDGKPRIEGRRISVNLVAEAYTILNWAPDEISEAYELSLAEVHAALSYYYAHQSEIDKQLEEDQHASDEFPHVSDVLEGRYKLMMTTAEIAEAYHLSDRTVREAIEKGWIKARKSGSVWLIRRQDAEARWGSKRV